MKKVFAKTSEVCAVWAAGEQDEARTGSNTRFRGDTLYSYGTAIAHICRSVDGKRVALISTRQWSSGTSKVQGEAWAAAGDEGLDRFRVPALGAEPADVAANLAHFRGRVLSTLDALDRGRVSSADYYRKSALAALQEGESYARTMGTSLCYDGPDPKHARHRHELG